MTVVLFLFILLAAAAAAAAVVVRNGKRQFSADNQVVPGTPTMAPAGWAGAHSPEARLHRRLRDAVAAVGANPTLADAWMLDARVSLEQQALMVDERLIAVAALPERVRAEPLAAVAAAVDAVEAAVAALVTESRPVERHALDQAMAEVAERVGRLEQQGG